MKDVCCVCGEQGPILTIEGRRYCDINCLNEELAKTGHTAHLSSFEIEGTQEGELQNAELTIVPIDTDELK